MNERIFITAGGSGHRLDAIKDIPKALAQLPTDELVIERMIRMIPDSFDITICTGYRTDLMEELFPDMDKIITYDPDNPVGILCCIKQVLHTYDLDSYIFILGDTIWHPGALKEAFENRHNKVISCCGNRIRVPCETYMITITGPGINIIKNVLSKTEFIPQMSVRKKASIQMFQPMETFKLEEGKWWLLEQWMQYDKSTDWDKHLLRMVAQNIVDDFDIDYQYKIIWQQVSDGLYDLDLNAQKIKILEKLRLITSHDNKNPNDLKKNERRELDKELATVTNKLKQSAPGTAREADKRRKREKRGYKGDF